MKIRIIIIIVFIGLISIINCTENPNKINEQSVETVLLPKIENLKSNSDFLLSSVTDSLSIVRLEIKPNCIIGNINKVIVDKNRIFIFDKNAANAVFEFDMKGKFIRKYGQQGKGPGEYTILNTFTINNSENELIIHDRAKRLLLTYNLENGEFIDSQKFGVQFSNFITTDFGYLLNSNNCTQSKEDTKREFSLIMAIDKEKRTKSFLKAENKVGDLVVPNNLVKSMDGVFYKQPFSNLIYKVDKDQARPFVKIKFKDKEIPNNLFENKININSFFNKIIEEKYTYLRDENFAFVNNKLIGVVRQGNSQNHFVYSLKTKKKYFIHNESHNDDFLALGYIGNMVGSFDGGFINVIQPNWIMEMGKRASLEKIKEFANKTNIDDNPILIFNHIKDGL